MDSYSLPVEIEIGGKTYHITDNGDFRMVMDCFGLLNDKDIHESFRPYFCLVIFYEEVRDFDDIESVFGDNASEAVEKVYQFFNCNQPEFGVKVHHNLIDWELDSQLICAAVNSVAQTEIRSVPFLHWFTFCGYMSSVKAESTWATVISLRHKKATGKKLEKHEREFIKENPQYFTSKEDMDAQKEAEDWLESVWNKE